MKSKLVSLFAGLLMAAVAVFGTALAPGIGPGGKRQAPDLRLRGLPREQPLLDRLASGPPPVRAVLGDAARNRSQDGRSHPGARDEVGAQPRLQGSGPSTCARASSSTTATASSRPRTSCTRTRCWCARIRRRRSRPFWAHGRGSEARGQAHRRVPLQGAGHALVNGVRVLALRRPAHGEQGAVGQGGRRRLDKRPAGTGPFHVRRAADRASTSSTSATTSTGPATRWNTRSSSSGSPARKPRASRCCSPATSTSPTCRASCTRTRSPRG